MKKGLILTILAFLLALVGLAGAQEAGLPNGVAAGDTTQTTAVLWARSSVSGPVIFEHSNDPDFTNILALNSVTVTDALIPVKVEISGLFPATDYYYRATDSAGATASGHFRTAAEVGEQRGLRFGVTGDWRGELAPYPAITNIPARELDLLVLLGDTIYADFPSPDFPEPQAETLEEYRIKHNEVYSERLGLNAWADARASTALLVMIDDHEVINDFAGGAAPDSDARFGDSGEEFINDTELYEIGLQVFQEYNPLRDEFYDATGDPRTAGERKLYRFNTYGSDAAIFLLDARSFRDEEVSVVLDPTDADVVTQFFADAFDPARTMLGAQQLEDLKHDLIQAQDDGITWKFVMVPEPIQNFGPLFAQDRFEGYAAERNALLQFIDENNISNVVFVAADIHGTIVNDLTYQTAPDGPQIPVNSFEISTGAVAFDAPFAPFVIEFATQAGVIPEALRTAYDSLKGGAREIFVDGLINQQVEPFGYSSVGLDDSKIPATLVSGAYLATHTYGWTEFEIDAETQVLTITTYGIDFYSQAELEADPEAILSRVPEIMSQFTVKAG